MARQDFILLVLVRLCILKVCLAENCDLLQDQECETMSIKNGSGCYKWDGNARLYNVVVRCDKNFHLRSYPNQKCMLFKPQLVPSGFDSRFQCILDNTITTMMMTTEAMSESVQVTSELTSTLPITTSSKAATITVTTPPARTIPILGVNRDTVKGLVLYIVIATLGVVLINICIIVGIYWKRRRTGRSVRLRQMSDPSESANYTNIYDSARTENGESTSHMAIADHNDFNNVVSMDLDVRAENINENEYHTLHENAQRKPGVQTNTSSDNKDTYSHTPRHYCHAQADSETYSHLTSDGLGPGCSAWKDMTDNVYNKLSTDDRSVETEVKDSTYPDPNYDHTFIHREESATIDNDTYTHVNDCFV